MGDEDDDAIPGFREEERPDRRDDDDADGCGESGGCRVLLKRVHLSQVWRIWNWI